MLPVTILTHFVRLSVDIEVKEGGSVLQGTTTSVSAEVVTVNRKILDRSPIERAFEARSEDVFPLIFRQLLLYP